MSSAAAAMSDPGEHNLARLFDTVWAGYVQDRLPGTNASDGADQWVPAVNIYVPPPSPRPPVATKPGRRPLPPTPGMAQASPSPPPPPPPPFDASPQASPRAFSTDSHPAEASSSSRTLPPTPTSSSNGFYSPSTSDSPSLLASSFNLDRSSSFATSVNSMSRSSSLRPPGARAPIVPGQYSSSEESLGTRERQTRERQILDDTPEYTPPSSQFVQRSLTKDSTHWVSSPASSIAPTGIPAGYNYENGAGSSSSNYQAYNGHAGPSVSSLDRVNSSNSFRSGGTSSDKYYPYGASDSAGPSNSTRRNTEILYELGSGLDGHGPLGLHSEIEDEEIFWEELEEEDDESRFINFSLLSHIGVQLRDKVPRGTHVKGSIPYPRAFTGKDIVSTIQSQIQRELAINHGVSTNDRRAALQVARSLQSQLFFYEVEWGGQVLQDGVEDVYMFMDDLPGASDGPPERAELPTGVVTVLTKCYSPGCDEGLGCYAPRCPRKGEVIAGPAPSTEEAVSGSRQEWINAVPQEVLRSLPPAEVNRQTIIHKLIDKEEQYIQDLDTVESVFIRPLRAANPPIIATDVDDFIDEVFGNIMDLRECNRRLLEVLYVRQREQAPVIQRIGDVFLDAATEFRYAYPTYIGHHPLAEKRLKEELENNPDFRRFIEQCSRDTARAGETMRLELRHFLERPSEHLQKYPVLLEAICHETAQGNPDVDFLMEAIEAIKNLQTVAQIRTFQSAMGRGTPGKWEWHDIVSIETRQSITKEEAKRQSIIFELIKGEMGYVKDLENIDVIYIRPLRAANPPVIAPDRLEQFIHDVFHNFAELHAHHRKLVEKLHEIQREEHPLIRSVTAPVMDAALNFRESYLEYIPNYPIASYRIDDELATNPDFKAFVESCVRHPDAHRLDMKNFINRPIPRLLRYELLLRGIMDEAPHTHEDRYEIPQVLEVIKALGKDTEPGVVSAKQKVELWRYNSNITFKPGESIDMDLLDANRSLIHTGRLLRQPDGGLEQWNGWSELYVLLFDNYLVMTKPRERDGVTKYHVNRRPIPLDLLTLVNFTDPPAQRGTGLLRNLRGGERHNTTDSTPATLRSPDSAAPQDSRSVYPCTIHCNGRLGGNFILYAESSAVRAEWKQKLEEAVGLRKVVQESNKVFEIETLSSDTFLVPSMLGGAPSYNLENSFTGRVTCSVPFNTADGRALVAIGCAEGVWIGFRHDSRSMRRVLHLKLVTQCTMLEDFGIFLVLADKSLFAYHIEALVPSSPQSSHNNQTPQKLNGNKDVSFFSVGQLHTRTLVIWARKKGLESTFYVLEPVRENINEKTKAAPAISRFGFRSTKSDWFREYREFFIPSEAHDLVFLRSKLAVLHTKGFEIMDLIDFKSRTIPSRGNREDAMHIQLTKRCDACKPIGMFRTKPFEFLLVYDEFGVYVDQRGEPCRGMGPIEWEGTANRVALHNPYILLFDTRFIEIRHLQTGRLAQIIPGNNIHCIWDGRGLHPPTPDLPEEAEETSDERIVQEARIHVVSSANDSLIGGRHARAIAQHVFELIPTIPLYLPGSLASPSNATYFPTTYSPPHSPVYRPTIMHQDSYNAYSEYSLA